MDYLLLGIISICLGCALYDLGRSNGYEDGENAFWERKYICYGDHPKLERTGWDDKSCYYGRARFYCPKCDSSFTENGKRIPDVIDELLFLKECKDEVSKEEWETIEVFLRRILEQ